MVSATRDSGQAELGGDRAIVGDAALGEVRVLRLQPDGEAEGGGILHGAQHHLGIEHGRIGLAEGDAAGLGQFRHLGQPLAGEADSERADRIDVGELRQAGAMGEHLDQAGLVERRIGIRRAGQAGDAARSRGGHFRFQCRLVLEAGLAQAGGEIDQAGADDAAGRIDGAFGDEAGRWRFAMTDYCAVGDEDVRRSVDAVGGIDEAAVLDVDTHDQAPASMAMTAIRTAMPKVTCGRITAWRPSATAESISTPRFIGPGCMTMASGLASASIAWVRP
jgi:hypothetical protein